MKGGALRHVQTTQRIEKRDRKCVVAPLWDWKTEGPQTENLICVWWCASNESGMGIQIDLQMLGSSVVSSVKADTVTALYTCVAAALGFDSTAGGAAMDGSQVSTASAALNLTGSLCPCDQADMNGTKCKNSSCLYNPVSLGLV